MLAIWLYYAALVDLIIEPYATFRDMWYARYSVQNRLLGWSDKYVIVAVIATCLFESSNIVFRILKFGSMDEYRHLLGASTGEYFGEL